MGTDDDIVKKYLTKKDFALYQKDKAKARFSQRELDPSTVSKNNQMAFKYAIETQLGKDTASRKEYDDLKPGEKAILFNQFKESGVINFGRTGGTWYGGNNYGIGKTPPPSTNKSTNNTSDTVSASVSPGTKVGQIVNGYEVISLNANGTAEVRKVK